MFLPIEVAKNVSEKCSKTINMLGYPSRNEAIDGSMVVQSNEEVQKILTWSLSLISCSAHRPPEKCPRLIAAIFDAKVN